MSGSSEGEQIRRLLQVGRGLVAEHDTEGVLDRILKEAREITGARYAALGVLDESRQSSSVSSRTGSTPPPTARSATFRMGAVSSGR